MYSTELLEKSVYIRHGYVRLQVRLQYCCTCSRERFVSEWGRPEKRLLRYCCISLQSTVTQY